MGTRTIELPDQIIDDAEALAASTRRSVTEVFAIGLDEYRKRSLGVQRVTPIDSSREMKWLEDHGADYPGKWVALDGDRLIAVADDGTTVYRKALEEGVDCPMVAHLPESDALPFGGW